MGIFINTDISTDNNFIIQKAINEVYIGKTQELIAIENQLDKFRNKYMGKYVLNYGINSDPELLKFDRMMEDYFGFGCFTMKIHNQAIVNAFIIPIDYRFDAKRDGSDLMVDKKGYKFKKEYDYSCIIGIYSGAIFNPNFTTEEIMSLILHEVGHNFTAALSSKNGTLINLYVSIAMVIDIITLAAGKIPIDVLTNTNLWRKFVDSTGKKWREDGFFGTKIYDFGVQLGEIVSHGVNILNNLIRILSLGTTYLFLGLIDLRNKLLNPISLLLLPIRYKDERTADNFVTMYGYGKALVSAQGKFESKEVDSPSVLMKNLNNIPVLSTLVHMNELPGYILLTALDEHPSGVERARDQLKLLKRELTKDDLDPKMKKVIAQDIKACEESINKLTDTTKGLSDPYLARHLYNKFLMNTNNTFKNLLFDDVQKFEKYDDRFKEKLNK